MLTPGRIKQLVVEHSKQPEGYHNMIASMFTPEIIGKMSEVVLIVHIDNVSFEHKATTSSEDDEYYMAFSTFDGKYYIWATSPGAGFPTTPIDIKDSRPIWFDED